MCIVVYIIYIIINIHIQQYFFGIIQNRSQAIEEGVLLVQNVVTFSTWQCEAEDLTNEKSLK